MPRSSSYLQRVLPMLLPVWAALGANPPSTDIQLAIQANDTWSPDRGPAGDRANLGYLKDIGQFRLTEATLILSSEWRHIGFRVDGGAGDFYKMDMAGDSWKGPNQYVSQAFLILKPDVGVPIRLELGKFFSSVGAEVPQSYLDFNTTRSLLFWYGSPAYHAGVRATSPVTRRLTVGVQLLSGCNTITGMHGHQTIALTASWTAKHWSVSEIYMGGNEKPVGRGWRQLSDSVFNISPSPKATAYFEFLGAEERRITPGYDRWFGWASAWRFSPWKNWSISPRMEWYDDQTGFSTGYAQRLSAFTLTGEYRPVKFVVARLEYRNQWSNLTVSLPGQNSALYPKQTMIAGLTFLFEHRM